MARAYRTPHGVGGGPFVFTVKLLTADGTELPLPVSRVTADTPADAARQVARTYVDSIRRFIKPPVVIVEGPFGSRAFPTDKAWRGRRPADKETAAMFGGR